MAASDGVSGCSSAKQDGAVQAEGCRLLERQLVDGRDEFEVLRKEVMGPWKHQLVRLLDRHFGDAGDFTDVCIKAFTI